ncbi:MAG: HYR domain-containing protein [Saprospiraceae bacterium]
MKINFTRYQWCIALGLTVLAAFIAYWIFAPTGAAGVRKHPQSLHTYQKTFYIQEDESGRYQATSPVQNLNFVFASNAFKVRSDETFRGNNWDATYTLSGIAVNGENLPTLLSPAFSTHENRLSQQHGAAFRVDFTNEVEGLRQDFVILEGPKDQATFEVSLQLKTNLKAQPVGGRSLLLLDQNTNRPIISYQDLQVFDASGKNLAAEMRIEPTQDGIYEVQLIASGSDLTYPVTIDPLTAAQWSFEPSSDSFSLNAGNSVAGCNVNGDAYGDLIVGVPGARRDSGEVRIFLGSASGLSNTPAVVLRGFQTGGRFGFTVACGGDLNGDGREDVLVGAPYYDENWNIAVDTLANNADRDEGAVFIYYGEMAGLSPGNSDTLYGERDTMRFGFSLASAGYVNNDGRPDIIVGAPNYSAGVNQSVGRAQLFYSTMSGIPTNAAAAWTGTGTQPYGLYGFSVSGAGDQNNDNFDDFLVGAPGENMARGNVYFYNGGNPPDATADATYTGEHNGARLGVAVACVGDFNDDGKSDFALGSDGFVNGYVNDSTSIGEGAVYVYLNHLPPFNNSTRPRILGPVSGSRFGASIAKAGDVNNDGNDDFIVGAPLYYSSGVDDRGAVFGFYGGNAPNTNPDWFVESDSTKTRLGNAVAGLGDVNGDGVDDVAAGAAFTLSQFYTRNITVPNQQGNDSTYVGQVRYQNGAAYAFYGINGCGLPKFDRPVFTYFLDSLLTNDTVILVAAPGECGAVFSWAEPTVDANCPNPTLQRTAGLASGSTFPIGTTIVTYRVTDSQNKFRDSSFYVIVRDEERPIVTACNETIIVNLPAGQATATINYPIPTFSDNCPSGLQVNRVTVQLPAKRDLQVLIA